MCLFHSSWKFTPRQTRVFKDINYLHWNLSSSSKTKSYFKDTIWKDKIFTFLNNFKMGLYHQNIIGLQTSPQTLELLFYTCVCLDGKQRKWERTRRMVGIYCSGVGSFLFFLVELVWNHWSLQKMLIVYGKC